MWLQVNLLLLLLFGTLIFFNNSIKVDEFSIDFCTQKTKLQKRNNKKPNKSGKIERKSERGEKKDSNKKKTLALR